MYCFITKVSRKRICLNFLSFMFIPTFYYVLSNILVITNLNEITCVTHLRNYIKVAKHSAIALPKIDP